jgi:hypothetical protein
MGVCGQRHTPAVLYPRGKNPQYPLYRRHGGPQSRSGHKGYRRNPLPLPGIKPRSPSCPVHSQTLYWLSYLADLSYNYMLEFIYRNHNKLLESWSTDGIFSLQFCFQKTMIQYIITYVHRHWEWNNLNHSERKICGVIFLCTWVENSQPGYYVVLSHLGLSAV